MLGALLGAVSGGAGGLSASSSASLSDQSSQRNTGGSITFAPHYAADNNPTSQYTKPLLIAGGIILGLAWLKGRK